MAPNPMKTAITKQFSDTTATSLDSGNFKHITDIVPNIKGTIKVF